MEGKVNITALAIIRSQSIENSLRKVLIPTGVTQTFGLFVNVKATKNSSHAIKKENILVATIPGKLKGNVILSIAPTLVQPSIIAASSNSGGIKSKKPFKNQVLKGRLKATFAITKPYSVFMRWSFA